jgi:hypothetical protein
MAATEGYPWDQTGESHFTDFTDSRFGAVAGREFMPCPRLWFQQSWRDAFSVPKHELAGLCFVRHGVSAGRAFARRRVRG